MIRFLTQSNREKKMPVKKLETLGEAWAFNDNIKSFPIEGVEMASRTDIHRVFYDDFFVECFTDYLEIDDEAIELKNFAAWAKYCEWATVTGYSGEYKHFYQLPVRLQRKCYQFAQQHPYCNDPNSIKWSHVG